MDYSHRPVSELLRGPLLHTPQGLVVVASALLYALAAFVALILGVGSWLIKSPAAYFVICFAWPFLTFLYFARSSAPGFAPSKARTFEVAVAALLPVAFAAWKFYVRQSSG